MPHTNPRGQTTHALLAQYAELISRHGVNARQPKQFLEAYGDDQELVELAEMARWLKSAVDCPPAEAVEGDEIAPPTVIES